MLTVIHMSPFLEGKPDFMLDIVFKLTQKIAHMVKEHIDGGSAFGRIS